ncbi:hypothetical protein Tco_0928364 [Tanacetum coccineum]
MFTYSIKLSNPWTTNLRSCLLHASSLWERLFKDAKFTKQSNSWNEVISQLNKMPSLNNIWSIVRRLVFSAPVYHTWSEKKLRLFTNVSKECDMLYNEIVANVRLKLSSLKVKQSVSVKEVARLWNIKW